MDKLCLFFRNSVLSFLIFCACLQNLVNAQSSVADSLEKQLKISYREDTTTVNLIYKVAGEFFLPNRDSALYYMAKGIELSRKINFSFGECEGYLAEAWILSDFGNTSKALELYFKALQITDQINNYDLKAFCLINISSLYDDMLDEKRALEYSQKAYSVAKAYNVKGSLFSSVWDNGYYYTNLNMLDSGLFYFQETYQLAQKEKILNNEYLGQAFSGLGYVNSKLGNDDIALPYLTKATAYLAHNASPYYLSYNYGFIAQLYEKKGNRDSAIEYALKELSIGKELKYTRVQLDAYSSLINVYQNYDASKALEFYQIQKKLTDSLYSADKNWAILNLTVDENERQKELELKKEEEIKQHNENIQYAALAIGVVTLLILFLVLSRSIVVKENTVKFLGIVNLLILFEFINLLIHPYFENITGGSPVFMLLILVVVAALIVPFHHWLEKFIVKKMVEKNKKIRLQAAKKTIAELEGSEQ